jgi:hypothetical protein
MKPARWLGLLAALAVGAAACSSSSGSAGDSTSSAAVSTAAASTATSPGTAGYLSSVCPKTIQIQLQWYPQPDPYAMVFGLIGSGGKLDSDSGSYSGSAAADPTETIQIDGGGPMVGYQQVYSLMYSDPNILLGDVSLDQAISAYKTFPTVSVIAPFQQTPLALMFNPKEENFKSLADVKASGVTVLTTKSATFAEVLVGLGLLTESQVDTSFDDSPARFVASNGKIAQQAYSTEDPYSYENASFWGKPVGVVAITNDEYPNYGNDFAVTPSNLKSKAACLKRLVPLMQTSMVSYMAKPGPINTLVSTLATEMKDPSQLTVGAANYATKVMESDGLVANEPNTATFGGFDMDRVQKMISITTPVFKNEANFDPSVTAADLATNQFIDPNIGFSQ